MPCRRGGCAVLLTAQAAAAASVLAAAFLSLCRFPPTLLLLQGKRPGLPSWFHQLNRGFPVRTELPHCRRSLLKLEKENEEGAETGALIHPKKIIKCVHLVLPHLPLKLPISCTECGNKLQLGADIITI